MELTISDCGWLLPFLRHLLHLCVTALFNLKAKNGGEHGIIHVVEILQSSSHDAMPESPEEVLDAATCLKCSNPNVRGYVHIGEPPPPIRKTLKFIATHKFTAFASAPDAGALVEAFVDERSIR